jgi:hypothetical protein
MKAFDPVVDVVVRDVGVHLRSSWRAGVLISYLCALLIALTFSETPTGRMFRWLLVELPARQLAKLTPAGIGFGILLIAASVAVIAMLGADSFFLIAQGVPESLAWFVAFDVATYLDVVGIIWLMAATVRMRAMYNAACSAADRAARWVLGGVAQIGHLRRARNRSPRSRGTAAQAPKPKREDWSWFAPAMTAN